MNFEEFLEYYSIKNDKELSENAKTKIKTFLNQVKNYVIELESDKNATEKTMYEDFFSLEDNIKFIICLGRNTLDSSTFYFRKRILSNFVLWLSESMNFNIKSFTIIDKIDNYKYNDFFSTIDYRSYFWNSISEIIDTIDYVGNIFSQKCQSKIKYDNNFELLYLKSLSILFWNGFLAIEIIDIKKNEIISNDGFYIKTQNKSVEISEYEYKILNSFANCNYQYLLPRRKKLIYLDGEYLFRVSKNVGYSRINRTSISNYLKVFNECASEIGLLKILDINFLKKCSMFNELYINNISPSPYAISKYFKLQDKMTKEFTLQYRLWKKYYNKK